jgi:hypothetical protein
MRKNIIALILSFGLLAAGCRMPSRPVSSFSSQPGEGYYLPEPPQPTQTPFQPDATAFTTPGVPPENALQPVLTEAAALPGSSVYLPLAPQTSHTIWIDPALPAALRQAVTLPPDIGYSLFAEQASLRLTTGDGLPLSRWVYTLAAPFPTLVDGVALQDLRLAWTGQAAGPFSGRALLVDESTLEVFTSLWGAPGAEVVQVLPAESLLEAAWQGGPSWAILPFEALEPRWKVLEVDSQSPLRVDFDPLAYPLSVPVSLVGEPDLLAEIEALLSREEMASILPASNRDPDKLTVLAMTGVTALVRATAYTMEQRGILYPGKDIGPWLREADITHISNEVPFASDCPYPNPVQKGMRFCSADRYIALMEDMGTDVVELTGDHFQDWGQQAMLHTLEMYRQRGWGYYGGGENLHDGRKALIVEHNGNRLAFIGCNGKGGSFAQAGASRPGAVTCDFPWMEAEIARLRAEGYLPVATFQHFEYYTYKAQPNQIRDFRALARAGAVVISGSQAHQPQAMEFLDGVLIHYGLGNLFFDQYDISPATRQGFIDRHVFYDGRYIGTELLTIQFVDYARPRPMTPGERQDVLTKVFKASGW